MMSDSERPRSRLQPFLPTLSLCQERSGGENDILGSSETPGITLSITSANLAETSVPEINARNPCCGRLTEMKRISLWSKVILYGLSVSRQRMGPARVEDLVFLRVILSICLISLFDMTF